MIRRHPVEFLAAAVLSLVAALISIRFWQIDLAVPFDYYWDSIYFQAQVKGILENGTIFNNPSLGAPFNSQIYDFAGGDALTLPLTLLLSIFTTNSAVAMNLVWLTTFPLAAATAWWAMRSLGVPGLAAVIASVVFAILPFHFWRGESHLMLSVYYTIPLAGYLIIRVLLGDQLFRIKDVREGTKGARSELALFISFIVLIGYSGVYYAILPVVVLTIICGLSLLVPGRRASALTGLAAVAGILIVLTITLLPSLSFRAEHGRNPEVAERTLRESEWYGLALTQLLLPATNHRFQAAADLKARYLSETVTASNDSQALGAAGAIGLVWILIVAILSIFAKTPFANRQERAAGAAALISVLIATVGGGSALIALLLTAQIRGWERMSILIAFFAVLGLGFLLGRAIKRIERLPAGSFLVAGFAATVVIFAIYDQTPARWQYQFRHRGLARMYEADQRFVHRVEKELSAGRSVLQLPYLKFPEGYPPPGTMADYDPLRGYLHSKDLKWSYGAMKGRAADIGACLIDLPPSKLTEVAAAIGYDAIWIDRDGYEPQEFATKLAQTRALTGDAGMVSEDGRFHVINLHRVRVDADLKRRVEAALPSDANAIQDCAPLKSATGQAPGST